METDSDFRMRSYCCYVEWLTTCSNLDKYALKFHSDDRDAASIGKYGFASHTKHTAEATITDLLHS